MMNMIKSKPYQRLMKREEIEAMFQSMHRHLPNPKGELRYVNPYTLLVAVVLSAQATDKSVNLATESLFKKVQTPEQMLALGEETLRVHIKTIGLYRTKARNVIALSQQLIEHHQSHVPRERAALEKLPGVGRKTANVVLNIAFGKPTIAVDTHLFRLANRLGLAPAHNVLEVEKSLEKRIPKKWRLFAHHWLILHGRYICMARKPKCHSCHIAAFCQYKDKVLT
ncbi:MAG: endonuclease III [Pseudomonadota bacterium]